MSSVMQRTYDRQIALWLFFCAAMIVAMILLGGVTRLTHSGLSMVEWRPLMGAIPPLSETQWLEVFGRYQQFPEYQKINEGMSLADFKAIFLFEYAHRLLGRLIGLVFLVPMLFFLFTRRVRAGLAPRLWLMFVLGGLQGLLGWYMVKSGLVDEPRVSQYRLTAHLGAAVAIYGYIVWMALGLWFPPGPAVGGPARGIPAGLRYAAWGITGLLFLMILSGGLVAGTRAGLGYNTFPLMGDSLVPMGLYDMQPAWLSAFEDGTTIQFNHRVFAYTLFLLILGFAALALRAGVTGRARGGVLAMAGLLLVQFCLGVATLLTLVPVTLASAHQAGALCLFTASLLVSQALVPPGSPAGEELPAAA